ncbi:MAG: hypothetical protein OXS33_09755 [bacterium]|nr:hypothetical protein [bacterium]
MRSGVTRQDACVVPGDFEKIVGREQEMVGSACGIKDGDVSKFEWLALFRGWSDEKRQVVNQGRVRVGVEETPAQAVLDEEIDNIARGEELVADGKFATVAGSR